MRILQIAPPWFAVPPTGYGGIEAIVALLCDGLVDAGHDVTLLASGGSDTKARLVTVYDEPPSARLGDGFIEAVHVLAGYRRRHEFDVIHDHTGHVGLSIAGVVDGPEVVRTLHSPWTPEVIALHRAAGHRPNVVTISHDQARRAPADIQVAGVVPNGLALDDFTMRTDRPTDDGYLLFVGRAAPEKGPATAIEVAKRLGRKLKMLIKVNEALEKEYWNEVLAPALEGVDVEVQPSLDAKAKAELFAGASATLCPLAWAEPFGLMMVESMACGTPVIAFARGAAQDLVDDGRTGFLVPRDDIDAMCEAVGKVSQINPADCRSRVETLYSAQAMVNGYLEVFDRVTSSGRVVNLGAPRTSIRRSAPPSSTHTPRSATRIADKRAVPTWIPDTSTR